MLQTIARTFGVGERVGANMLAHCLSSEGFDLLPSPLTQVSLTGKSLPLWDQQKAASELSDFK